MLRLDIEGQMVDKVLVDRGTVVNLLPKTILKRFKLGEEDLVKNDIMKTNFNRRYSNSMG